MIGAVSKKYLWNALSTTRIRRLKMNLEKNVLEKNRNLRKKKGCNNYAESISTYIYPESVKLISL